MSNGLVARSLNNVYSYLSNNFVYTYRFIIQSIYPNKFPYEPEVKVVVEKHIREGSICLDIGANIGQYSLFMANIVKDKGHVYAFEANPDNCKKLEKNIKKYHLENIVAVLNYAVSDKHNEEINLYKGSGGSSFQWNIMGHDLNGNPTEAVLKVRSVTLNGYFSKGERIDFVKIDVEGAEALVIEGMKNILITQKPLLLIEFHDEEGWRGRNILFDNGYSLYDMQGKSIKRDSSRIYHCIAIPN